MPYLVLIFSLITMSLFFIRFRRKRARLYKLMDQFDGPPTVPILGNVLDFKTDTKEMYKYLVENYLKKFDDTFKIWLLHVPIVVIFKPEDIQILASKNLEKDSIYEFLAELMGDGLITCSMNKWKRRRRIVNPAFQTPYLIKNVLAIFQDHFRILSNTLKKQCETGIEFDVWPHILKTTFNVICESSMGFRTENDPAEIEKYSHIITKSCLMVGKRVYKPWLHPSPLFNLYKYLTGQQNLIKEAQDFPRKVLHKRKMGLLQKKHNAEGNIIKDVLDMIGEAKGNSQYLNEDEITDEMTTIIMSGAETTAITISFNLLMMAIHPDIQERVYEEQKEIFGLSDRESTFEDLGKMIYLEQCLKETLRWVSMVGILFRRSDEEIELSDGRIIPTEAKIVIASIVTHHIEKIYPNSFHYNPDNFLPEKEETRHPGAFIPFGYGVRTCLGQKYAMMAMKVLHSLILRKYKLRTSLKEEDIQLDYDFILRSANGYPIKLEYRN